MPYVVKTASVPHMQWGVYRRIAILEVETPDTMPAMISIRARGVRSVVYVSENLHVGKTAQSAYAEHLEECQAECAELNLAECVGRLGLSPHAPHDLPEQARLAWAKGWREWEAAGKPAPTLPGQIAHPETDAA